MAYIINTDNRQLIDAGENQLSFIERPNIIYGDGGVFSFDLLSGRMPLECSTSDTWELYADTDYIHTTGAGLLANGYSGAVTSIEATDLTNRPELTGFLLLQNSAGERDRIPYSEYNAGTGIFTVDDTLENIYLAGDSVLIEDQLVLYSGNANFNNSADREDVNVLTGKICVRYDALTRGFLNKITAPNTRVHIEIWRYIPGQLRPQKVLQDDIYCSPTVGTLEGAPSTNDPVYYTAAQTLALLNAGYEIELSDDGITWYELTFDELEQPIMPLTARWWHYRNALTNGNWSATVPLLVGPKGDDGDAGADGTSSYTYIAYASDNAGTGFNLTPSAALPYRAEIVSATALTPPTSTDFASATWVKYIGEDGADGVGFTPDVIGLLSGLSAYDAEPAGFSYLASDTGDVYFKLSSTTGDWSGAIPFQGGDGADGTSSYTYIAYASDDEGTGFNLTPSAALPYRAEIVSATALTPPTSADFASATWVKYIGEDGASTANAVSVVSSGFTGNLSTDIETVQDALDEIDALELGSVSSAAVGVIYDPSKSSPFCQKIILSGTQLIVVENFAMLPAHGFKRCVMDDLATRHVNYYLDANDSTKKADGTAADLTGADGDVMVEIPITYWKYQTMNDGRILYLVSDKMFSGASIHPFFYVSPDGKTARNQYVGAYQSTICDASGTRIANMMNQDATASSSYAAGYKARSVAGCKPWTSMPQSTHRTAAANNGAQGVNSLFHQYLFLMMLIEGGSFDNQSALSVGFSYAKRWMYQYTRISGRANFGNGTGSIMSDPTIDASVCWETIVVNGVTAYRDVPLDANNYYGWSVGSDTYFTSTAVPTNGSTVYTDTAGTDSGYTTTNYSAVSDNLRVVQFSYRGIENPYGEIWKFEDGIQKYQNVVDDALTGGCYWWTAATSLYTDVDQQAAASPTYARVPHAWPATGYVKTWRPDNFLPLTVGGASTTYLCDYFYNDSAAGARVVLRGGNVDHGAGDGGGSVHVTNGLASASTLIGGRLAA